MAAASSLLSWISEPLPLQHPELELVPPALQFSLSETSSSSIDQHPTLPWIGSELDPLYRKTQPVTGRVGKRKRKSRASNKNLTTYISTDTANFREMVQHVTGVGFDFEPCLGSEPGSVRPEMKGKAVTVMEQQMNCVLPTLDTSAFLLERDNEAVLQVTGRNPGFQMDPFSFFPTLESWGVM